MRFPAPPLQGDYRHTPGPPQKCLRNVRRSRFVRRSRGGGAVAPRRGGTRNRLKRPRALKRCKAA
eukprot:15447438-Alexandrium_andersonii.AAC.1